MSRCEPEELAECYWTRAVWSTIPLALLATGSFGNILNIIVLSRPNMRKNSTSVYLLCLAGSDLLMLWTGMVPRMLLQAYKLDIRSESSFLCKIVNWLNVTAGGYSAWVLVLMTLERVFATKLPVLARVKLSRTKSVTVSLTVLIFCVLLTSHVLFSYNLVMVRSFDQYGNVTEARLQCKPATAFISFYNVIWPVVMLVTLNVLPILIIIIGNTSTVLTILLQRRKIKFVPSANGRQQIQQTVPPKVKSATKMLFLVSAMAIVTSLPFTITHVIFSAQPSNQPQERARKLLIYSIVRNILYCNFTFNFVLYFVSGTLFKQEWKAVINDVRTIFGRLNPRRNRVFEFHTSGTGSSNPSNNPETEDTKRTF